MGVANGVRHVFPPRRGYFLEMESPVLAPVFRSLLISRVISHKDSQVSSNRSWLHAQKTLTHAKYQTTNAHVHALQIKVEKSLLVSLGVDIRLSLQNYIIVER